MTSKDFRIGNYILYDGKLDRIDIRYALAFENEFMNGIKPIPLTEQWLLDFGFEEKTIQELNDIHYEFDCMWIYLLKDFFEIELIVGDERFNLLTQFKYVHQLQNLYFALTGKELTK